MKYLATCAEHWRSPRAAADAKLAEAKTEFLQLRLMDPSVLSEGSFNPLQSKTVFNTVGTAKNSNQCKAALQMKAAAIAVRESVILPNRTTQGFCPQ